MASAPDPRKFAAEQHAEAVRNVRIVLSVDEKEYTLRLGELTARHVKALREEKLTVSDLLAGAAGTVGTLDLFAAAVWMARHQAGEIVTLAEVQDDIRLDQVITARDENEPEPAEEFLDPPVSGGS